jgi:hypothetical protein
MATVATVLEVKQRYYDLTAQSRAKDNKDGSLIPKMEALQDDIENIPDYVTSLNIDNNPINRIVNIQLFKFQ